ncbi:MAG: RNase adapter RapZ [Anaerofustis stercorihominis]|nr:RNase adapter RapZ [Anaerofustis stercorihominis]
MQVVLISGMLAAGKSIALRVVQDLGYYCVDNLPANMIKDFIELVSSGENAPEKIGLVVDMRGQAFFKELEDALAYLSQHTDLKRIFVDADDDVLIQRYKTQRRRHIMSEGERLELTIKKERELMSMLKGVSDYVIDTSLTTDNEFRAKLLEILDTGDRDRLQVALVSFGFKYGIPTDADYIFDVRFIKNPYHDLSLRHMTGLDAGVKEYISGFDETKEFTEKISSLLDYVIPQFINDGRRQLIVAFGCTGGRHRSVFFAESMKELALKHTNNVDIEHRDIHKDSY